MKKKERIKQRNSLTMDRYKKQENNNCPIHSKKELIYVCTDPKNKNSLICATCVIQDKVQSNYLLEIEEIINSNNETVFLNWPLQNDSDEIEKIQRASMKKIIDFTLKEKINTYFGELKLSISKLIDSLHKDMLKKADHIWNFNEDIISLYNKLSSKESIKNILNNSLLSFDQKNTQLKDIILKIVNNQYKNKEYILDQFRKKKAMKKQIDFKHMKEVQSKIMTLIQKIDIVVSNNMNQLKPKIQIPFIQNKSNYSEKLQIELDDTGYIIKQPRKNANAIAMSKFNLDNSLAYILCCTFNQPYNIDPQQTVITILSENRNFYQEYERNFRFQETDYKVIKGDNLSGTYLKSTITCMEFRICISTKEFYIADYPEYKNINRILQQNININQLYRLGVLLNSESDNFSIKIDKVRILKDKSKLCIFESR